MTTPHATSTTLPATVVPATVPTDRADAAGAAWVAAISRIGVQDRVFAPMHVFTYDVDAFGAAAYVDNMPLVTANPDHVLALDADALRQALTDIAVTARAREERNWVRSRAARVAAERAA